MYRPHPLPLAAQRGDDALLDCLLYFTSLGAQASQGRDRILLGQPAACLLGCLLAGVTQACFLAGSGNYPLLLPSFCRLCWSRETRHSGRVPQSTG